MSDKKKYPGEQALAVAKEICDVLKPITDRLKVCGSLRRRQPLVGDVEIVFIARVDDRPDPGDLFGKTVACNLVDLQLDEWLKANRVKKRLSVDGKPTWGPLNKLGVWVGSARCADRTAQRAVPTIEDMPVDFFATNLKCWWTTVVIRTGPKELNLKLIEGADANGLQLHAYDGAFTRVRTGEEVIPQNEQQVFELCGYEYLEPWDRHDLKKLVRAPNRRTT